MLKAVILATSMLVAAPVFAQDKPAAKESQPAPNAPPTTTDTAPATDDAAPDAAEAPAAVAATPQANPAPAAQTAQPTPQPGTGTATTAQPATTAAAEPAAAQPAASQDQVAQAVGRDWGTYDKDGNDALSASEFGAWMSSLRKASEPSFVAGSPEAKTWEAQAFTSADSDKSATVNKQELTVFLTPKAS